MDLDKILKLKKGETYDLGANAHVKRIENDLFELFEYGHGGVHERGIYTNDNALDMINDFKEWKGE